jgi:hypothetical protein
MIQWIKNFFSLFQRPEGCNWTNWTHRRLANKTLKIIREQKLHSTPTTDRIVRKVINNKV